jgi:arylsulfatase A
MKIIRPFFLLTLILSSLAFPICHPLLAREKPNIIFMLADDLGYGDLRSYNPRSKIPTPHLDQLASQGVRFLDAHSPSAVCTPTRYSFLTGRYAWRTSLKSGVLYGYDPLLIESGRLTMASLLKTNGYHTGAVGKWHLGFGSAKRTDYSQPLVPGPNSVGFDYFYGIPASLDMAPYVYVENERVVELPDSHTAASAMRRRGGDGFWREGPIAPGFKHEDVLPLTADKAVEFIRNQSSEKPFFLHVAWSSPHTPWLPTPEFRGKSRAGYYGDFVAQTDAMAGRILDALDDQNLAENTLVIFTSDNGAHWLPEDIRQFDHLANLEWRGQKADIWEGGHRVPFIARWPGKITPHTSNHALICLTDMLATVAAILHSALPDDAAEDSFNFLPALLDSSKAAREVIIHHSLHGAFAIREGAWKLCLELGSGGFTPPRTIPPEIEGPKGQLYNLATDPGETNNLWLTHPEQVARLTALLEQYQSAGRSRK